MGKRDGRFMILLDIDKVFSSEDLAVAQDTETGEEMKMAENAQEAFG